MSAETVTPMYKADRPAIRAFLGRMFANAAPEQLAEIAWTDNTGKPNNARLFPCTPAGLDTAAEAAARASDAGRNVYFGVNPRKPGTPTGQRASDEHVDCVLWHFVDGDTSEADAFYTAAAEFDAFPVPTSLEVTTGTAPHPRRHLYWELDTPETDMDAWRARQRALASHYQGDQSVKNPSRIMRLPGSISYPPPKKRDKGYKVEAVAVTAMKAGRASAASIGAAHHVAEVVKKERQDRADGTELERAIANLQDGVELHNNTRIAVNRMLESGIPASVVEATIGRILEDVSDGGTLKQLPGLIASAVAKGIARLSPEAEFDQWPAAPVKPSTTIDLDALDGAEFGDLIGADDAPTKPAGEAAEAPAKPSALPEIMEFPDDFDVFRIEARPWVLGYRFLSGAVTAGIGAPGASKSTYSLLSALAIATGDSRLTRETVWKPGAVLVYNAEDDEKEIMRRAGAMCAKYGISTKSLKGKFFFATGVLKRLRVAVKENDKVKATAALVELRDFIIKHKIVHVALDPFISLHDGVQENANDEVDKVVGCLKWLCAQTQASIDCVHHGVKSHSGDSESRAGDMNSARGASALIGAARIAYTVAPMSQKGAKERGIEEDEAVNLFRVDAAKGNYSAGSWQPTWFRRISFVLRDSFMDGDLERPAETVGVPEWFDMKARENQAKTEAEQRTKKREEGQAEQRARAVVDAMTQGVQKVSVLLPTLAAAFGVSTRTARDHVLAAIPLKAIEVTGADGRRWHLWRTGEEGRGNGYEVHRTFLGVAPDVAPIEPAEAPAKTFEEIAADELAGLGIFDR